jgi:hypothetical protein
MAEKIGCIKPIYKQRRTIVIFYVETDDFGQNGGEKELILKIRSQLFFTSPPRIYPFKYRIVGSL